MIKQNIGKQTMIKNGIYRMIKCAAEESTGPERNRHILPLQAGNEPYRLEMNRTGWE